MNVPDKIFQSHSWLDINIFMFVKRNTKDDGIKVSLQRIADEFGVTRGKVYYALQKMYKENLLSNTSQTVCKQLTNNTTSDTQAVKANIQTASKQFANSLQTLGERKHAFGEKLIPFVEQYGKKMIREFYDYWTEANENGRKMRFEKENTFEVQKRLARWHKTNLVKKKNNESSSNLPIGMNLQNSKDKDYTEGLERWNR